MHVAVGHTAGESASANAGSAEGKGIDFTYIAEKHRAFLKPAHKESGVDPDRLVTDLQKILFPAGVLIIMNEERLTCPNR